MYVELMNPVFSADWSKYEIDIVGKSLKSVQKDIRRVEKEIFEVNKRLDSEINETSIAYYREKEKSLRGKEQSLRDEKLVLLRLIPPSLSNDFADPESVYDYLRTHGLIPKTIPKAHPVKRIPHN